MLEEKQRMNIKKLLKNQIFPTELLMKNKTYLMTFYYLFVTMQ